jgi:alkylhydroperoxidase/carboxymuconolactone decarboxylase family protein YurZ
VSRYRTGLGLRVESSGLDQKTRSILTLGILAGLGRFQELGIYTNGDHHRVASGQVAELAND